MERPTCGACPYFQPNSFSGYEPGYEGDGICCRYPPTFQRQGDSLDTLYPEVSTHWFCGEHPRFPAYLAAAGAGGVSREGGAKCD